MLIPGSRGGRCISWKELTKGLVVQVPVGDTLELVRLVGFVGVANAGEPSNSWLLGNSPSGRGRSGRLGRGGCTRSARVDGWSRGWIGTGGRVGVGEGIDRVWSGKPRSMWVTSGIGVQKRSAKVVPIGQGSVGLGRRTLAGDSRGVGGHSFGTRDFGTSGCDNLNGDVTLDEGRRVAALT